MEKNDLSNDDENVIKDKSSVGEKFSLTFRKKWISNTIITILVILILIAAYICLNLWVSTLDLPEIDVTENKIYTLTDASKEAIEKVNQEITIYAYGFEEDGSLIKLLKQYNDVNENIKYEILTDENNPSMVSEYQLSENYYVLILKTEDSEKIIDGTSDFTTYDYTTYQTVDTTEQVITNSILALTAENKPKVYFVEGHGEFSTTEMVVLTTYLENEAFEVDTLNIATTGSIPDDCDILVIMSPSSDFYDTEAQIIKDYINKGGEIYFSQDVVSDASSLVNIQSVLDEYGVSVENGYIIEQAENQSLSSYPYIFMPQVSSTNSITADIYSDSYMWLVYAARLQFKDDDTLSSLNVEKETLLSSSDEAIFTTDLESNISTAMESGTVGTSEIASLVTKTITTTDENGEETTTESKLVIVSTGSFISDYTVAALSSSYPLSYLGSNKDFTINALSYLGDKGNTLTIRKDYANATYSPTEYQNRIVLTIVFALPIAIIFIGIMIGVYRKKRK